MGRTPAHGGNEGHLDIGRASEREGGRKSQGMLQDRKWPVWLHRACEEKIGDKGGKALALIPRSPESWAQSGHCSQKSCCFALRPREAWAGLVMVAGQCESESALDRAEARG